MKYSILSYMLFAAFLEVDAQIFVQLEVINDTKTIKYAPGQKMVYMTSEFPDYWHRDIVKDIDFEQKIIIFEKGMEYVDNITKVKIFKIFPFVLSRKLYAIAAFSSLILPITYITSSKKVEYQDFLFIIPPAILGYFLDKLVSKHIYTIGRSARLQLLDLRLY